MLRGLEGACRIQCSGLVPPAVTVTVTVGSGHRSASFLPSNGWQGPHMNRGGKGNRECNARIAAR